MANLSRVGSQYRDGVFSKASPAPRYGTLLTAFEDGSLGALEEDAVGLLDPALKALLVALDSMKKPTNDAAASALAIAFQLGQASLAIGADDIQLKLSSALAASYAASQFGFPPDSVPSVVNKIFGIFAMTSNQRNAVRQHALALYEAAVAKQKGNAMSGAYRDGVLGSLMHQNGAFQDGSLGLFMHQNTAYRDGSLGRAARSGKKPSGFMQSSLFRAHPRSALRGLGGGCGCSGMGDDAIVADATPFYKKPVVLAGGAAIGLGVLIFALSRKK